MKRVGTINGREQIKGQRKLKINVNEWDERAKGFRSQICTWVMRAKVVGGVDFR